MLRYNFFIISIIAFIIIWFPISAFASCLGSVPLYGSGATWEDCQKKSKDNKPETRNSGPGAGHNNVNVWTAPPNSAESSSESSERGDRDLIARHQVRLEISAWVISGADNFDKPGMPEKFFFNGGSWEYYLNPNLSFGILFQQFSKTGGRDFDDIAYQDASGDTHILASPGSLDRLQTTIYMPYVGIHSYLTDKWGAGFRFGIGRVEAAAEYSDSSGMSNKSYDDNTAMMIDAYLDYRWGDVKIGSYVRYVVSNNDSNNYLEYLDMGSAQVGISAQWMIRDLGGY